MIIINDENKQLLIAVLKVSSFFISFILINQIQSKFFCIQRVLIAEYTLSLGHFKDLFEIRENKKENNHCRHQHIDGGEKKRARAAIYPNIYKLRV